MIYRESDKRGIVRWAAIAHNLWGFFVFVWAFRMLGVAAASRFLSVGRGKVAEGDARI